jgi:FkbM family methyltransferase
VLEMVTLREVFLSIWTTRNFWDGLMLTRSKKPTRIKLRTGVELELRWPEYQRILCLTSYGYTITAKNGTFCCRMGDMIVVGSDKVLPVLCAYRDKYKVFDYHDKVVLDIGGFMGETAVMFTRWGAKKIIIYEPVVENHVFIRKNVELNKINAEIHIEGIGETDSLETIAYEEINQMFGLLNIGRRERTVRIRSAEKVIDESGADIAKINCEGSETALLSVTNDILSKVPNYVIETHSQDIRDSLLRKFVCAGFKEATETRIAPGGVSIIAFKKRL